MTNMFVYNGQRLRTINYFTGCEFSCSYCWARRLITTRLKGTLKYKDCGFKPTVHEKYLDAKFKAGEFCFISSLGDLSFAPNYIYAHIFETATKNPATNFLMCTKSPSFYSNHFMSLPNLYFGCTIETNKDTSRFSKAPPTELRGKIMTELEVENKFISIEPIIDFNVYEFTKMIVNIAPKIVEVGADNYRCGLPEPSSIKLNVFLKSLEANGINVIHKSGLERLLK